MAPAMSCGRLSLRCFQMLERNLKESSSSFGLGFQFSLIISYIQNLITLPHVDVNVRVEINFGLKPVL